jgi:hypothetical protein
LEDEEQVPPSNAAETGKSDDEEGPLEPGAAATAHVVVSFLAQEYEFSVREFNRVVRN